MEIENSNIAEYKIIRHNSYTYGIGPNVEPTLDIIKAQELWRTVMLLAFYIGISIFVAGIHCKLDSIFIVPTYWSALLIPFSVSLVPLSVYCYLYIKSLIGYTIASFFCMKTTIFTILILCITTQIYLIMIRVDEFILTNYSIIFLPTYLCIFMSFMLFFILIPLSISCQMPFIYYGFMLAVHCICSYFSLYYLIKKLDSNPNSSIQRIFQPFWVACGVNLVISLLKIKEQFWTIIFLLLTFIFTLEEYLRIDDKADIPWWMPTLTFALAFAITLFAH